MKITSNENNFAPGISQVLLSKIQALAMEVYLNVWNANNVRVDDDLNKWLRRSHLQIEAAEKCNDLLALIYGSQTVYHIRARRIEYWSGLIIEVRNLVRKWNSGDKNRYTKLISKK